MAFLNQYGLEYLISKMANKFANVGSAYNEIHHSSTDNSCIIGPNTFHVWDEVEELDISFTEINEDKAHEFLFQFTSGSEPTTLTIYGDIKWANGEAPVIEANKIYQISILKGLGSVLEFNNASLFPITITVGASGYYEVYSYFMTNYSLPDSSKPSNAITISEQIIIEDSNDSVSGAVIKASIGLSNRLFLFTEKSISNYYAVYINESGYCDTYFYD